MIGPVGAPQKMKLMAKFGDLMDEKIYKNAICLPCLFTEMQPFVYISE